VLFYSCKYAKAMSVVIVFANAIGICKRFQAEAVLKKKPDQKYLSSEAREMCTDIREVALNDQGF